MDESLRGFAVVLETAVFGTATSFRGIFFHGSFVEAVVSPRRAPCPITGGFTITFFQVFNRMYKRFDEDRHLLAPSQFCEVRYEDLVSDPIEQMQAVYARLGL